MEARACSAPEYGPPPPAAALADDGHGRNTARSNVESSPSPRPTAELRAAPAETKPYVHHLYWRGVFLAGACRKPQEQALLARCQCPTTSMRHSCRYCHRAWSMAAHSAHCNKCTMPVGGVAQVELSQPPYQRTPCEWRPSHPTPAHPRWQRTGSGQNRPVQRTQQKTRKPTDRFPRIISSSARLAFAVSH